jgi:hypothetical protein
MSDTIIQQRYTTQMDEPFVVFVIGMRVNKFWQVRKWAWVAAQMGKMIPVLYQHPEKGFLGGETFYTFAPLAVQMVSYWRSFDHLERFARSKDDPHLKSWQEFYKRVGMDGSVGIYHETYLVEPGKYEAVYANMPPFGLAKAANNIIPVNQGHRLKARGRLNGREETLQPELELPVE